MDKQQNFAVMVQTRCTLDLRDALEKLATDDHRTLANYIRLVLENHVRAATAAIGKRSKERAA
jgi:predicted DNA-binding protein